MIDAHLHTWDRSRSRYAWLDDAPERLRADHPLTAALDAVGRHGVERAVLVQADETLAETAYLLELAAVEPRVAGAVVYLPLEAPDVVAAELPRLLEDPRFVGVRNLTHDRPDPDWLLGVDQRRSIETLERAGVPIDVLAVLPRHLENLARLAREHDGATFVLDHLGTPPVGGSDDDHRRWQDLLAEAALPNVVAKLSGIYRRSTPEQPVGADAMRAVLDTALEVFGAERLMIGSDWPVCTAFSGTDVTLSTLLAAVDALPEEQARRLRGETAAEVYRLRR